MKSKYRKGAILSTTAILTGLVAFFVGWNSYNSKISIDNQNETSKNSVDISNLKGAVGDIADLQKDMTQVREDVAASRQLLHDLSQYRFQYDPKPSENKAILNNEVSKN